MKHQLQYHGSGAFFGAFLFVLAFLSGGAGSFAHAQQPTGEQTPTTPAAVASEQLPDAKAGASSAAENRAGEAKASEAKASEAKPEAVDFLSRYRVGPGDVISIRLFGEDDLNKERIRLTDTGTIPYPVLGEIRVLGMRPVEIERFIEDGLRGRYLKNPRVSVTVDEYRPYFITGEVGRAGSFPYVPGITVLKAITIAGGFKERASRSKIFISKEDNPKDRRKVDLGTPLEPGDILTIEESFF